MKKGSLITILIILGIIIIAFWSLRKPSPQVDEATAKCIGQNSELYIKLGCYFCKAQEDEFGDTYVYLNTTDCFYEPAKCNEKGITATPTWIINGKKIIGVQLIEKLKELTGC